MFDIKKLENICAIIIIVAFFFPWVSLGIVSFSGYELPNLLSALNSFASAFSENGESSPEGANYLYAVYLIPLLSIGILIMEYLGKESKNLCFIAGSINVIGFLYSLIQTQGEVGLYGIGIWVTVLASIAMLLSAAGYLKVNSKT